MKSISLDSITNPRSYAESHLLKWGVAGGLGFSWVEFGGVVENFLATTHLDSAPTKNTIETH